MMPVPSHTDRRARRAAALCACALALLCCAAALAQESGSLDSLAVGYLKQEDAAAGQPGQSTGVQRQADADLGLMLERQLTAAQPGEFSYYTLGGFWYKTQQQGLADLWRQNNANFLAKPAAQRTGEGLIPDIQIPLPALGGMLGSGAEIKLNGLEKITLGGQQTVYPNSNTFGTLAQQNSNFDLKIKQDTKVNLEGVIGDRVHVLIDYDTQVETEKKSKVRLRYDGKEDEILQKLEAGDTEFSLTGSGLVGGLTTEHKGLFGVKAEAKLAGLELTAIASKDEGQSQSSSFSGSNRSYIDTINDINYIKHRFFNLDRCIDRANGDSIVQLRVFVQLSTSGQQTNRFYANFVNRSRQHFANWDSTSIDHDKRVEEKLSPDFFSFGDPQVVRQPNYLYLRQGLNDDDILGVVFKVMRNHNPADTVWVPDASIFSRDSTVAKNILLLKRQRSQPPDTMRPGRLSKDGYDWNYELRNFYSFNARQILPSSLNLSLLRKTTNGNDSYDSVSNKSFLYLVGLDYDNNGKVDGQWLKLGDDSYFYLPMERPFADSVPGYPHLPDPNYSPYTVANTDYSYVKYRFVASYLSSDVNYVLSAPGRIIEGSVKAYLNGAEIPASAYRIDYDTGEIEFTDQSFKDQIKQPNAQLKIDYQYLPSFALGSKTLIGVRGVYKFSDKAQLGGTWLYRSEQTPEDKPRLGEEPRRIIVAGLDGSVEANPDFLTRAANALPLVETEAASTVKLAGELAANFPNPNTKGQVYIDDMDGSKQSDDLILDRAYWSRSSVPPGKTDSLLADTCYWYVPTVKPTLGQINPEISDPNTAKELYNSVMMLHMAPRNNDTASWAGITTMFSKTGVDFTDRTVLNVWVKGSHGRLHVDIGKDISEDQVRRRADGALVPANGLYDTEPLAANDQQTRTNANDVGIDGIAGVDASWTASSLDDGNDDQDTTSARLYKINGTENNGQFDTEDLKLTGKRKGDILVPKNEYYTCSFPLDSNDANAYGWHKYQIPLSGMGKVGGPYNWNDIYYSRLWLEGLNHPDSIELALVEVSGNIWAEQGIAKRDTSGADTSVIDPKTERLAISTKNNRDDADYSSDPPFDPGKDENGNVKFEQSLVFNVYNLGPGHVALARKSLREHENNYTGYKTLRLYVHGQSTQDTFLVRLVTGTDTGSYRTSYYQYKAATTPGWQEVTVELDKLSSLKKPPYSGYRQDGAYSVKGSPNLINMARIVLGVVNGRGTPYTGQVWFDELRLDDVRKDGGTALRSTVELRMADLLSLTGSYSQTGAHFYTMGQQGQGSGVKTVNYSFSTGLTMSKFYLDRLGFNLPLTFGQSVSEGYPEFGTDDIRLTPDESKANKSWRRDRNAGYSLSRSKPTNWWLTDLLIQPLSYSGSWAQWVGFNQLSADSSATFNQSLGYGWTSRNQGLKLVKGVTLYYLPSSLSASWSSGQSRQWHLEKSTGVVSTANSIMTRTLTGSLAWKLADQLNYSFTQNRDLKEKRWQGDPRTADGWLIHRLGLGSEINRSQRVDFNTTLAWLKLVKPTVGYSTTYSEQHVINLALTKPHPDTMTQNVSNANGLSVANDFPLGEWLGKLAALRSHAKDDSAEAGSPRWLLVQMESLIKNWQGVQVSFKQDKSNSANGLLLRPNVWYQLGWHRQPSGIGRFQVNGSDAQRLDNTYAANSQARLGPVNLSGSWGRTDSWNTSGAVTNYSRTDNWPTLRADVTSVERLWPQALTSSRLASSYSLTTERNWQQDHLLSREAKRKNFTPLVEWSASWRPKFSTSMSYEWTTIDLKEPNLGYPSGWRRDYSVTKKFTGNISYAFTAEKGFSLKLWKLGRKRFKFANELRLSLSGSYGIRTQKLLDAIAAEAEAEYTVNNQDLALNTSAEYRFSNSITASLTANYGSTKNLINSVSDSKQYGLNMLVNIIF